MKSKLSIIYGTLFIAALPVVGFAANCPNTSNGKTILTNTTNFCDLSQVVSAVVGVVQVLLIMATVLYLLYAGLMFVTARGEPGQISKARDALLWGMVGAALILGAEVIVKSLQSTVGSVLK